MKLEIFKLTEESWRQVEAYPNYYVSDLGRVINVVKKRFIGCVNQKGYVRSIFHNTIGNQNLTFHRLVARAFIPNPEVKPEVNHKNGNKTDNRAVNLEWSTRLENVRHAHRTGLASDQKGEKNNASKLTDAQVVEIRKLRAEGYFLKTIAEMFGVKLSTIGKITTNKIRPQ